MTGRDSPSRGISSVMCTAFRTCSAKNGLRTSTRRRTLLPLSSPCDHSYALKRQISSIQCFPLDLPWPQVLSRLSVTHLKSNFPVLSVSILHRSERDENCLSTKRIANKIQIQRNDTASNSLYCCRLRNLFSSRKAKTFYKFYLLWNSEIEQTWLHIHLLQCKADLASQESPRPCLNSHQPDLSSILGCQLPSHCPETRIPSNLHAFQDKFNFSFIQTSALIRTRFAQAMNVSLYVIYFPLWIKAFW